MELGSHLLTFDSLLIDSYVFYKIENSRQRKQK